MISFDTFLMVLAVFGVVAFFIIVVHGFVLASEKREKNSTILPEIILGLTLVLLLAIMMFFAYGRRVTSTDERVSKTLRYEMERCEEYPNGVFFTYYLGSGGREEGMFVSEQYEILVDSESAPYFEIKEIEVAERSTWWFIYLDEKTTYTKYVIHKKPEKV